MADLSLDIRDDLTSIGLVPTPVKRLGSNPELDDEIAGQVLRRNLAAFLPPQPNQGSFVIAHDDPGVRTADKIPPGSSQSTVPGYSRTST